MKPPPIDYPALVVGTVLIKEFFIVGLVPSSGIGFYICGSGEGVTNARGQPDPIAPCIGTNRKQAEEWFETAKEKAYANCEGKLVLIELNAGKVIQFHQCTHEGAQEFAG